MAEDWRDLIDEPEEMPEHLAHAMDKLLTKRPIDGANIEHLYPEERLIMWLTLARVKQQAKKDVAAQVSKHMQRYVHKHQHWVL